MLLVVCQLSRGVIVNEDVILTVLSLTSLLKSPSIDRLHSCDQQLWKLFIVLFAISCSKQKKTNYLNSHGVEAQEKPPGV